MSFLSGPESLYETAPAPVAEAKSTAVSMGDILRAQAIYEHADTEDFVNPVPERDFSAHAIRYFQQSPKKLSLDAMRGVWIVFLWDEANLRQHPRLEILKELYAAASDEVRNEMFKSYIDQVIYLRRQAAGEFK